MLNISGNNAENLYGWKNLKIEEFADVVGGGTPKTNNNEYFGGDIPWLTPNDLSKFTNRYVYKSDSNITELGLKNSSAKLLPKDTILFSSRAPIGYVALAGCEITTNQGFKSLVCNPKITTPQFVFYLMKFHTKYIEKISGGTTFN